MGEFLIQNKSIAPERTCLAGFSRMDVRVRRGFLQRNSGEGKLRRE
jgi:hypothetical protein